MAKKGQAAAPTPVDPTVVANAQSQANIATAQEQQKLNLINTSSPYGSVNYTADPNSPGGYSQTTTLSPEQQGLYNSYTGLQQGALGTAGTALSRVNGALGQSLDPNTGALTYGVNGGPIQSSFDQGGQLQSAFNTGSPLQTSYATPAVTANYAAPSISTQPGSLQADLQAAGLGAPVGGYDQGGAITTNFQQGQPIQGQVNYGDFGSTVANAANASYAAAQSRLDPQWNLQQSQLNQQLADQGLSPNSTAYQNAQAIFGRNENDAYNQANYTAQQVGLQAQAQGYGQALSSGQFANAAAGQQYGQNLGQAQFQNSAQLQQNTENANAAAFANQAQQQGYNELMGFGNYAQTGQIAQAGANQAAAGLNQQGQIAQAGINAQQAQFANAAAGQQYAQNMGAAQFANTTAGQQYQQNLGAAEFGNNAQNQGYTQGYNNAGLNNQALGQAFSQTATAQNTPINQFSALLGQGQVTNPQGINYSPTQVGQTDVTGAYALNAQQQEQAYQAQLQQQNSLMGGLFNLGSAAIKYSDARLKEDIRRVGQTNDGLPIYAYRYLGSPTTEFGVLAQEVAQTRPDAVYVMPGGLLAVDYGALS